MSLLIGSSSQTGYTNNSIANSSGGTRWVGSQLTCIASGNLTSLTVLDNVSDGNYKLTLYDAAGNLLRTTAALTPVAGLRSGSITPIFVQTGQTYYIGRYIASGYGRYKGHTSTKTKESVTGNYTTPAPSMTIVNNNGIDQGLYYGEGDLSLITIDSINGGNPITAGQTGINILTTGAVAKPLSVAATYAAGTKSITATIDSGGTANSFTISIQDRVEGEDWPLNNSTVTCTFTYAADSAAGNQFLVKKADEVALTVSGGITSDPATWTYWLTQDGFTVEGGELVYDPYGDLVLTADGGGSATNAGTFTSWFRPATGTGAGNVYAYQWVVSGAGVVPVSRGVTGRKLKGRKMSGAKLIGRGI